MDSQELDRIIRKIDTLKDKRARTQGARENIEKVWQEKYHTSSLEEIKSKQADILNQRKELDALLEQNMDALTSLTNWGLI